MHQHFNRFSPASFDIPATAPLRYPSIVTAETMLVGVVRGTQMRPVGTPAAGAKGKDEIPSQSTFRL